MLARTHTHTRNRAHTSTHTHTHTHTLYTQDIKKELGLNQVIGLSDYALMCQTHMERERVREREGERERERKFREIKKLNGRQGDKLKG